MLELDATVAQSVEQLIRNQQVAGSSPASSSKKNGAALQLHHFIFPHPELEICFPFGNR